MQPAGSLPASISIVVPNFNSASTLARALESLVDQHYPALEIIVIDGGSTDGSVEVIRRFEKHIAFWQSAPDRGQSDAINQGLARARGDIVNWLCSDDVLLPGALRAVGEAMADPAVGMCIGKCDVVFTYKPSLDRVMWPTRGDLDHLRQRNTIGQPSCFFRRDLLRRNPPLCEDLSFTMDQELWCYLLAQGCRVALIDRMLSRAIQNGANKTKSADYRFYMEVDRIFRKYGGAGGSPTPRWYRWSIRPLAIHLERRPGAAQQRAINWMIQGIGAAQKRWRIIAGRPRGSRQ